MLPRCKFTNRLRPQFLIVFFNTLQPFPFFNNLNNFVLCLFVALSHFSCHFFLWALLSSMVGNEYSIDSPNAGQRWIYRSTGTEFVYWWFLSMLCTSRNSFHLKRRIRVSYCLNWYKLWIIRKSVFKAELQLETQNYWCYVPKILWCYVPLHPNWKQISNIFSFSSIEIFEWKPVISER